MSLDLSAEDRKALAKDLAAELDTGRYGSRFVLSRRQLLSIAGGSAGVAGLVALGVDPATAQSAAGQVGTPSSPEDVFAFDLDVGGALQSDLDAGGQAINNVGSVSTDKATIESSLTDPAGGVVDGAILEHSDSEMRVESGRTSSIGPTTAASDDSWATATTASGTVTFDQAFSSAPTVITTLDKLADDPMTVNVSNRSTDSFVANIAWWGTSSPSQRPVNWVAIGPE